MADITIARRFEHEDNVTFPVDVELETHAGWGKTWLAKLGAPVTDRDHKFGVAREFLEVDGRRLSRAGNGELRYTIEEPGYYEASAVYRSYRMFRVVFEVAADGRVTFVASDQEQNLKKTYRALFAEAEAS